MNTTTYPQQYQETELGELPREWDIVRLGDIATLQQGRTPSRTDYSDSKGYRIIKVKDFGDKKYINFKPSRERSFTKVELSEKYYLKKGDILILSAGHSTNVVGQKVGYVAETPENQAFFVAELIRVRAIQNKALAYFTFHILNLNSSRAKIREQVKGGHLFPTNLSQIIIPLPPLHEQQNIAYILATVQEAQQSTERVINSLQETKKSLMKHLYNYGIVSFQEADKVKLKETEIGMIPEHWKVSVIGDIVKLQGKVTVESDNFVSFEHIESGTGKILSIGSAKEYRTKTPFVKGTLLYGRIRPYLNKIWLAEINGYCTNDIIRIVPIGCDIVFLKYVLQAPHFVKYATEKSAGTKMPRVKWDAMVQYKLALPNMEEQKQIASILSAVDEKINAEEQKKKALEETFNSLLKNLMTAKIRVKNFSIENVEKAGLDKSLIVDVLNEQLPANMQVADSRADLVFSLIEMFGKKIATSSKEEVTKNLESARKFASYAEGDLKSSKTLFSTKEYRNAVHLLQQSVEKLVKAYCFAFQILSEKEIRDVSHKSPMAFVKMINRDWVIPYVELMRDHYPDLKTDTKELELVINKKDEELTLVNEKALDAMLTVLEKVELALVGKTDEIKQFINQILTAFEDFFTDEQKGKMSFAMEHFDIRLVCAFMDLYILSAVTYSHLRPARYPDGKLQAEIYTENLAVVHHAERIFKLMDLSILQLNNYLVVKNGENRN